MHSYSEEQEDDTQASEAEQRLAGIDEMINQGKNSFALKELRKLLTEYPEYYSARASLIVCLMNLDDYKQANAEAETLVADCPESSLAFFELSRTLHGLEKTQEALEAIQTSIRNNVESADARAFKARIHLDAKQAKRAEHAAVQALELEPTHSEALSILSCAYLLQEDHEKAQEVIDRHLRIEPDHYVVYDHLAYMVWTQHNDIDQAIELYKEALRLNPKASIPIENLKRCYATKYASTMLPRGFAYLLKILIKGIWTVIPLALISLCLEFTVFHNTAILTQAVAASVCLVFVGLFTLKSNNEQLYRNPECQHLFPVNFLYYRYALRSFTAVTFILMTCMLLSTLWFPIHSLVVTHALLLYTLLIVILLINRYDEEHVEIDKSHLKGHIIRYAILVLILCIAFSSHFATLSKYTLLNFIHGAVFYTTLVVEIFVALILLFSWIRKRDKKYR